MVRVPSAPPPLLDTNQPLIRGSGGFFFAFWIGFGGSLKEILFG